MIKRVIGVLSLLTIGVLFLQSFKTVKSYDMKAYSTSGLDLMYVAPNFDEIEEVKDRVEVTPKLGKSYNGFKEALAFKESSGDYQVINQFGYLGKYQFGMSTLAMIGVKDKRKFLKSSTLQERAFYANLCRNKWILRRDLKWFVGRYFNGVEVTESGVLAAAHLAGPGAVKKYLRSGGIEGFADAFGTTIRYYMKRFAGYDVSFVKANRRPKVDLTDI